MYLSHLYIVFHFILFILVFIVTSVELAFTSLGYSSSQLYTNCIIIIFKCPFCINDVSFKTPGVIHTP